MSRQFAELNAKIEVSNERLSAVDAKTGTAERGFKGGDKG